MTNTVVHNNKGVTHHYQQAELVSCNLTTGSETSEGHEYQQFIHNTFAEVEYIVELQHLHIEVAR